MKPQNESQRKREIIDEAERQRREKALDEAIENTFPASDPVSAEQPVKGSASKFRALLLLPTAAPPSNMSV